MIDASISYDVSDRFTVRLDGVNLTGQGANTNLGLDQEIPATRNTVPSAVLAGISLKL